jgi:EmrB/QacA subfamily drug resistance transporter
MPKIKPKYVSLIVACALFMEQLDGSIIATALPSIAGSFHVDPLHLNLAITSYLFSLAVFIPLSGWVADRFGARTVFRAAIVVFVIGSVCCGASQNIWELVISRILQGAGGAMMVPVGRLVVLRIIPRDQLVNAMAWISMPALIGPVLGPPLGGFIVTYTSWRWIFYVNVPIGLLGLILATLYVPNIREERSDPLDLKGFLLMAVALAGLVFSFETVGRHLIPGAATACLFLVGCIGLTLYLLHMKRVSYPIIDLSILKYRTYRAAITGGSLFRVGVGAVPFLLPLMLQVGFGISPAKSGMLTFASAAGAMFMKLCAAPIVKKFGFKPILISNSLINAFFLFGCAFFTPTTWRSAIFVFLLIGGFFRSLQFTSLNAMAYAEVPQTLVSRANTLYSMLQQLSLSMGVAIGASLLNLTMFWTHGSELGPTDFWPAYIGVGVFSLLAVPIFATLPKGAGDEMSGHAPPKTEAVKQEAEPPGASV